MVDFKFVKTLIRADICIYGLNGLKLVEVILDAT